MMCGEPYFARVEALQAEKKTHLMAGIDPRLPGKEQAFLKKEFVQLGTYRYLQKFVASILSACEPHIAAVKFQSAFFEMFGIDGWRALQEGIQKAHEMNLLALLDAKRGDISSTMDAYYKASFEALGADALTVQMYMGTDILQPFFKGDFYKKHGVYVVFYSSNPSAKEIQSATLRSGQSFLSHFSRSIADSCQNDAAKLGSIGYVVGATNPIAAWSGLGFERSPLLLPGVGAQGGSVSSETFAACRGASSSAPVSRGLLKNTEGATSWDGFMGQVAKNAESLHQQIGWHGSDIKNT